MKKSKIFMIVGIIILCIAFTGSTYALYRLVFFDDLEVDTITYGLDYYIEYEKGQDIVSGVLNESSDYTGGQSADIEFWKNDDTYSIYGHIYLDIGVIGENISNSEALKYALVSEGVVISEGNLKNSYTGQSILLEGNIPLATEEKIYTVYIWLDENSVDGLALGETISATTRCEATIEQILGNAAEYITNLYNTADKFPVTNGTMTYNYAPSVSLMNDRLGSMDIPINDGNIRYYGVGHLVNNYIYFNCSNYTNQTNSTCERWRIIGEFDGKLKIMRYNYLGGYSWDYKYNGSVTSSSNVWNTATLNSLLNDTYYYARTASYYNDSQTPITVNFTSTGIKEKTRNLISDSTWYLEGSSVNTIYSNDSYIIEREDEALSGKIALPYASDYGYAADLNICQNKTLSLYNDSTLCIPYNWMKSNFGSRNVWLLNQVGNLTSAAHSVLNSGLVNQRDTKSIAYVFPTLYLDSKIVLTSGDGTFDNPYKLFVS